MDAMCVPVVQDAEIVRATPCRRDDALLDIRRESAWVHMMMYERI